MWYTGVGSRSAPKAINHFIREGAHALADLGWCLRSGHAPGPDIHFYYGHKESDEEPWPVAQIFLPWPGFNGQKELGGDFIDAQTLPKYDEAVYIAKNLIPWWDNISRGGQALHTRNVFQVLGPNIDVPSKALICWAPPDKNYVVKGGTGTAVRLAMEYNVPVHNLYFESVQKKFQRLIDNRYPTINEEKAERERAFQEEFGRAA